MNTQLSNQEYEYISNELIKDIPKYIYHCIDDIIKNELTDDVWWETVHDLEWKLKQQKEK